MLVRAAVYLFRRQLLYFLLLFSFFSAAVAQSHNNVIGNITSGDSLLKLANHYLKIDFVSAYRLAEKAYTRSVSRRDMNGIIESSCILNTIRANSNQGRTALASLAAVAPLTNKNNPVLSARLLSVKSLCYYTMGIYDSAQVMSEEALGLFKSANARILFAVECNRLARILIRTGDTRSACELNEKAQQALKNIASDDERAFGSDVLSEIYIAQHLLDKAIDAASISYNMFSSGGAVSGMASSSLHKGNAYYLKMSDDSAKKYYSIALVNFERLKDTNGIARCYSNLSRLFLEKGNNNAAIDYAQKALSTVGQGNYNIIKTSTLQHLGDIYAAIKQNEKAIHYLEEALHLAQVSNHKVVEKDCHKSLSEIYEDMHRPAEGYKHLLAAYRLKDSLQPILLNKQLAEMQVKYESEKKESQITMLRQNNYISALEIKEQENKIRIRNMIIFLSVLLFASLGFTFYFRRQKQMLKDRLAHENAIRQTEENERLRIAKDIHDEFGSGLSKINLLAELADSHKTEELKLRSTLRAISDTSRGLVDNMRDLIWAMNPDNDTLDHLAARLREYSHDYMEEFDMEFIIDFPDNIPVQKISRELSRNVFMILKESLQNIVKHASANHVLLKMTLGKSLTLEVRDNGKGFDPSKVSGSNGMNNIRARSRAIDAVLNLNSEPGKGSVMELIVPV